MENRGMCEDVLIEAAIASMKNKEGVRISQPNLGFLLQSHAEKLQRAIRGKVNYGSTSPYTINGLLYTKIEDICRRFHEMPTIIIPFCYSTHWGYLISIPHRRGDYKIL